MNVRLALEAPPPPCQHCQGAPAWRPRGLCHSCYKDPDIREEYPSLVGHPVGERYSQQGLGLTPPKKLPEDPCHFPPGSPQKLDALCRRAERGEHLWHPKDARENLE